MRRAASWSPLRRSLRNDGRAVPAHSDDPRNRDRRAGLRAARGYRLARRGHERVHHRRPVRRSRLRAAVPAQEESLMARKLPQLQRVLDAPALASIAYGEIASSIYFALGIIALHALGLTPLVLGVAGLLFLIVPLSYAAGASFIRASGGGGAPRGVP